MGQLPKFNTKNEVLSKIMALPSWESSLSSVASLLASEDSVDSIDSLDSFETSGASVLSSPLIPASGSSISGSSVVSFGVVPWNLSYLSMKDAM